ncbi:MAG: amidohydrolase family protein, partial [Thermoplasmata archaeon]
VPIMYSEGVAKGKISLERLVEVLSANPARIFGLDSKGLIAPGKDADIVIIDPKIEWKVSYKELHMNADWSPYEGMKIKGKVIGTILRGVPICMDGKLVNNSRGMYLSRKCRERL